MKCFGWSPIAAALAVSLLLVGCESEQAKLEDLYTKAAEAIEAGDMATAIPLLDELIAAAPQPGLYLERAQAKLKSGDDAGAKADCQEGLKLDPEDRDLKWLLAEMKKDSKARFKGKNQKPPGRSK
jgi:predicted Zn-dependent protease